MTSFAITSSTSALVGTWSLDNTKREPAQERLDIGHLADTGSKESALRDDARKLVPKEDFQPGGRYYSVVKLQIRYERQEKDDPRWAQGTGWLIRPDLLVTAGHCVYDHTYDFGRATEIKAYVGYNGKASLKTPGVQFRCGAKIATTDGWLQSDVNRANDVGFVQLDSAFEHITPIQFGPTPTKDDQMIGVVGYPADKTYKDEPAAQMYSMFRQTAFNLDLTQLNMLEYTISSFAGQSGSPVLIENQNFALGTHVYGLGSKNAASVIRGKYGNHYKACVDTFTQEFATAKSVANITYVIVPITGAESALDGSADSAPSDAEDFWDTFKSVISVGAPIAGDILQAGSPFLGPIGGAAAGLAGTLLGYAGKLAKSNQGTESGFDASASWKQPCSRAILAEAALQTVFRMKSDKAKQYQIYNKMQEYYTENKDSVKPVAKVLGPALLGPALRISQMQLNPQIAQQTESSFPAVGLPPQVESSGLGPDLTGFVQGMEQAAGAQGAPEFSFGGFLSGIVNVGTKVAPIALDVLGNVLKGVVGAESGFALADDDTAPHIETLCQRAVMADAALQSLMAIPPDQMKAEGFFNDMLKTVKKIGSTVMKAAPGVIRTVTPILSAVMKGSAGGGDDGTGPATGSESSLGQPRRAVISQPGGRTVADMLGDSTTNALLQSLGGAPTGSGVRGVNGVRTGASVNAPFTAVSNPYRTSIHV